MAQPQSEVDIASEPTVVSVERAFIILNLLAKNPDGMGTREISHTLGYGAGTVQKILNTLRIMEYITKKPDTDLYVFGAAALRLSHMVLAQADMSVISRPYLEQLAEDTGESIYVGVLVGNECVYVDKILSTQMIRMDAPLGTPRPLNCTAVGKALLAFHPEFSREFVLSLADDHAFLKPTENSTTDPDELYQELLQIREEGIAFDNREYNPSAACVAAPILDHTGKPLAAFSVSGPAERVEDHRRAFAEQVRITSEEISRSLGYDNSQH